MLKIIEQCVRGWCVDGRPKGDTFVYNCCLLSSLDVDKYNMYLHSSKPSAIIL